MMLDKKPLSLAEVKSYFIESEKNKVLSEYLKTFSELDIKKVQKLKEEIIGLNNSKIKEESIVKIIDLLPKDSEDVNKIFFDIGLTEEEVNSILNIVKGY